MTVLSSVKKKEDDRTLGDSGIPSKSSARGGDLICRPPKQCSTTVEISDDRF